MNWPRRPGARALPDGSLVAASFVGVLWALLGGFPVVSYLGRWLCCLGAGGELVGLGPSVLSLTSYAAAAGPCAASGALYLLWSVFPPTHC